MSPPLSTYGSSDCKSDGVVLTPDWFLDEIRDEFGGFFDPCPHPRAEWDALEIDWHRDKHNYVNPPYQRGYIGKFVAKAAEEAKKGCSISLLIPAYIDTAYFHDHIYMKPNVEIRFLKGRVKFVDSKTGETFRHALPCPLMHVVFNYPKNNPKRGYRV